MEKKAGIADFKDLRIGTTIVNSDNEFLHHLQMLRKRLKKPQGTLL